MGKTFAGCLLAFALVGATMAQRPGRRQRPRGGRDGQGYAAPPADTGYAAPSDDQPAYQDQDVYQGAASDAISSDDNLAMLEKSVPGVPGEDYPIYSEVPETGFGCEGQVDGGYYADPEAECQVFHICANDGVAAEREANSGAASNPVGSYASPDNGPIGGYDAPTDVVEDAQAAYGQAARNARTGRGPQQPFSQRSQRNQGGRRQGQRGLRG